MIDLNDPLNWTWVGAGYVLKVAATILEEAIFYQRSSSVAEIDECIACLDRATAAINREIQRQKASNNRTFAVFDDDVGIRNLVNGRAIDMDCS